MAEVSAIVEYSASNRAAFQEHLGAESQGRSVDRRLIDREQLAEAIIRLVNEDRRVGKAILDLVLTSPNVVVRH